MQISKTAAAYEARLGDVLRSVQDVLRRRYLILVLVAIAITAVGTALTFATKPRYQGVVRIQIDPSRNPLSKSNSEAQAQLASEGIETQVAVLTSLDLARSVARRLDLIKDPEFASGLEKISAKRSMSADDRMDFVANALEKNLDVNREKLTYVIAVKFSSLDPRKAAKIANEFAAAYFDSKVNNNIGTAQKQADFYQSQLTQMAADARQADEKVAQFKASAGIVAASNSIGTITDQQIGPLSIQLASAESVAALARSKERSAQTMIAQGKLDAISEVRNSQTVIQLKQNRALLVQSLGDMQLRYGDRYPDLIKVRNQIADLDALIKEEANRVVRSLKSDADAAEAQSASMRAAMQNLENKKTEEARASVMLASLQRDADSKHAAYDRMAQTTLDTRQATQASFAQAQIIDTAKTPLVPYFPNKPLMIGLSLMLGVAAGLATITTQELMVSGLSSVQDIEEDLGLTLVAAVPLVKNNDRPADLLIEKPTSQFAEALRNARASIVGIKAENRPKIIAMTSALPSEGKTTTALALARTFALNGDKTIILDVDVRRAQLRNVIDVNPNGVGTVELLRGEAQVGQARQSTRVENLDAIVVKKPFFSSENLFDNERIHSVLEELANQYDTVILDLPPLLGLADGRFIAALSDAVVLAIHWNTTPSQAIRSAVSSLRADQAPLVGAMYTMVEPSSHTYGSYYYYGNKYSSYYSGNS